MTEFSNTDFPSGCGRTWKPWSTAPSAASGRPLLKDRDPTEILKNLMEERYPVYAGAHMIIDTGEAPVDDVVLTIVDRLDAMGAPAPTSAAENG